MNADASVFDRQGITRTTHSDQDVLKSENTMAIDNQSVNADSDFDIKSSPGQETKENLMITDILEDSNEEGEGISEMDYASEVLSDRNTKEELTKDTNEELNTTYKNIRENEREIKESEDTIEKLNVDNEIEKDLESQSNLDSVDTNAYPLKSQTNIDRKENKEETHKMDEIQKRVYSTEGLNVKSDPIEVYNEEAELEYESSDDEPIGDKDAEKEDKADSNEDGVIVIEDIERGEDKYDIEEEEEEQEDVDEQTGNVGQKVQEHVQEEPDEEEDMFEIIEDESDQEKLRNDVEDADTDIEITNVHLIEKLQEKEKEQAPGLENSSLGIPVYLDLGDDGIYKLFPPTCDEEEEYKELPVAFEDSSVLPIKLESFFASLRQFFRMNSLDLDNDGELVLKFKDIGLCITEDNIYCRDLSILNILALFEGLRNNTKNKTLIKFMIIDISTRVRFITKFNELSRKLKNGGCLELTEEYIDITDASDAEADAVVSAREINDGDQDHKLDVEQQTPKRKHYDLLSEADNPQEYTEDASNQAPKRQKAESSKNDEHDAVDIDQLFPVRQDKESEPLIRSKYDVLTKNADDKEINDGIHVEGNIQESLVEDDLAEIDLVNNELVEDERNVNISEKTEDENDFGLIG
ncbi:hypothetical protein B5S30_g1996 [[Candida] boidinii]|nr:hypothetical protein B5S30_g1996 [[Candida] boidinii]